MVGHVDHGKSTLLDTIRKTRVAATEAGGITQAIGASLVPVDVAANICKKVFGKVDKIKCPGILFIDTPGHAAFTNLRTRGGNLADVAVLVVDITEGFMPQTIESIKILKRYKTPFIVAANKLDKIKGYVKKSESVIKSIESQSPEVKERINHALYGLVGSIYEEGFNSERFDMVNDYTKQVAIVPTSAIRGDGIAELLMLIMGLAQRFLESNLEFHPSNKGKGTVLEIKEEKGLGKTADVILFDGHLKVGDTIVLGGMNGPIVTKVKSLLLPAPLSEIRDKKTKFKAVKKVIAAIGVKISALLLEDAMAGTPLYAADKDPVSVEKAKKQVIKEIKEVFIETEKDGVIIKADSLGSLEALTTLAKEQQIPIRKATVGDITKKDMMEAESVANDFPELGVTIGFNVNLKCNPKEFSSKLILSDVIYKIFEEYADWKKEILEKSKKEKLEQLPSLGKFLYLPNHTFRQSNPAIIGVEVLAGSLRRDSSILRKDGRVFGTIKSIQLEKTSVDSVSKGERAAVAIENVTCNRQISEGEEYYTAVNEKEFRKFKEFKELLDADQKEILKDIASIMRKENPMWGL